MKNGTGGIEARDQRSDNHLELLVVVTIIVVLPALLVPAMDRAIYQAELAVCGTHPHGLHARIAERPL